MEKTFRFHSLTEFHTFCGLLKPEHPMISLIDYSQVHYPMEDRKLKWIQQFYSIGLKRNVSRRFNYGQQPYDFDSGVLSFVSPDQFLSLEVQPEVKTAASGWLLLIHPDFIWNTDLAKKINRYEFFQYAVNEALFLSDKEEDIIVEIFKSIEKEYQGSIDKFSQELIIKQVERLLIYSERFYERQFVTRAKSNHEFVSRFEALLQAKFTVKSILVNGVPTVTTLADSLHISTNYLSTLLRIYTQQNTQQHIQNSMIQYAKQRLSTTSLSISEIAYELRFEHSQSFSKLFKQKTHQSPSAFRAKFN